MYVLNKLSTLTNLSATWQKTYIVAQGPNSMQPGYGALRKKIKNVLRNRNSKWLQSHLFIKVGLEGAER